MPEISRFLGIVIYMYFNDHNPPHFHAVYNDYKASISIKSLGLMEGKLPSRVMSLVIERAEYSGNYTIQLVFNNGKTGTADLEQTIFSDKRSVFSKIKEKSNFKNFKVKNNTVVWFDELDLASEYLFYLAFRDDPDLQEQFRAWGYIA